MLIQKCNNCGFDGSEQANPRSEFTIQIKNGQAFAFHLCLECRESCIGKGCRPELFTAGVLGLLFDAIKQAVESKKADLDEALSRLTDDEAVELNRLIRLSIERIAADIPACNVPWEMSRIENILSMRISVNNRTRREKNITS